MKPRSLLIRDRGQIGGFGTRGSTLLVSTNRLPQRQPTTTTRFFREEPIPARPKTPVPVVRVAAPKPPQSAAATATTTNSVAPAWTRYLLEFVVSLMGGSVGAYLILFFTGTIYREGLLLALLVPLVLSELWEVHRLTFVGDTKPSKKEIKQLKSTKNTIQLRYGQGFFMSAGLAKVLSLSDPIDLLYQTPLWAAAWLLWTSLFATSTKTKTKSCSSSSSSKATTPTLSSKKQQYQQSRSLSA